MITGIQIKLARVALGLTVRDLASLAGFNKATITKIENGAGARPATLEAIQKALEGLGIEFIPENGGGVGVRLPKDISKNESE